MINWSLGGGSLTVLLGLACLALAVVCWEGRRRSFAVQRQIRLRAEAESDRLRLRISGLRPLESRLADMKTELAGLRPLAARVPELEEQVRSLRAELSQATRSIVELEREAAALRHRAEEADGLELEVTDGASRETELERELATANERLNELKRVEAALAAAREEIGRLSARVREGEEQGLAMSRELGALTEAVARREEAATLAQARVEAAEALIARRDDIILALEQRLAELSRSVVVATNGSGQAPIDEATAEPDKAARKAERRRKKEAKKAKKAKKAEKARKEAARRGSDNGIAGSEADNGAGAEIGEHPDDGVSDDLKLISGIGPVLERTLNDLGIRRWEQLAALDEREVGELSARLPGVAGRVERDGWVAQAAALIERHRP